MLVKIATPLVFGAPVGGDTLRFTQRPLVTKKTRMMGLSDGERISMIRSAVLIQYTRVTNGRTDRWTDGRTDGIGVAYTRYSIYAVTRKNWSFLQWPKHCTETTEDEVRCLPTVGSTIKPEHYQFSRLLHEVICEHSGHHVRPTSK